MTDTGTTFAVAAGGTGGHLFPAEALAGVLRGRGHDVHLLTDARGGQFAKAFADGRVHVVPSETLRGKNPVALAKMGLSILAGTFAARGLLKHHGVRALAGFGGYPTVPPGYAASLAGIPLMVHEANAVLGRANRMLASRSHVIAVSHETVGLLADGLKDKVHVVGNPVRAAVIEAIAPYSPPAPDGYVRLLVFGGSQGARFFSESMPETLLALPEAFKARLKLTQQCRPEDLEAVRAAYAAAGITAELAPFFDNLPARMADSHLVISRAGASTVAELSVLGRPALLVPLPGSLDQDQRANGGEMVAAGAAIMVDQSQFRPHDIAGRVTDLFSTPETLEAMAQAA
ncbi:MAG: undecaprenyldiphospho-muramoylpentapeptide beta-N-acetylglucosaminyltransferase, partial [Pseudomonadota bacterium]